MKRKGYKLRKVLKLAVVVACVTGFLLQTYEFLQLYWTYPTVVDIQVAVPSVIDLPAISFCSTNGINPSVICEQSEFCIDSDQFKEDEFCSVMTEFCNEKQIPNKDFQVVTYEKYMKHSNFNASILGLLRQPIEDIFRCKIKSAGRARDCDFSDVILGSYYSDTNLINFCYTLNSLWGNPKRGVRQIKKSERIEMVFYINISDGPEDVGKQDIVYPKFNYPNNPGVQLAIHSRYLALSPFTSGMAFSCGKLYQIKLEQAEKHLLPAPYQTNCTDYIEVWKARGGIGPLNQMMVVEECEYNKSLIERGCVPFYIDYPHNDTVCKYCNECGDLNNTRDDCANQLSDYNQPCDFVQYNMQVDEKLVSLEKKFKSTHLKMEESVMQKRKGFDCSGENIWNKLCQTVTIELVFDNFQITNLTYNAKFEENVEEVFVKMAVLSIELFSVIGGYMGMYLGVSIVAVYDFAEIIAATVLQFLKKKRLAKKKEKSSKKNSHKQYQAKIERSLYTPTFSQFH